MRRTLATLALLGVAACGSAERLPASSTQAASIGSGASSLALTGRVVDAAQVIDARDEQALSAKLEALEQATSDQMVVVTVASLEGDTIEHKTMALGQKWGIGRADVDNGVIILVAPNDHKVRVEVGLGLEGLLTDAKAAEVITKMMPRFRQQDYAGGLNLGVDAIGLLLRSDRRRPQPRTTARKEAA